MNDARQQVLAVSTKVGINVHDGVKSFLEMFLLCSSRMGIPARRIAVGYVIEEHGTGGQECPTYKDFTIPPARLQTAVRTQAKADTITRS